MVDKFGDNVMTQLLPGDHWRTKHYKIIMKINSMCSWGRVPTTVEVCGLFSHLVLASDLFVFEKGNRPQVYLSTNLGNSQMKLAEFEVQNSAKMCPLIQC